ncbi:MAG: MFS transporter [Anaerolineae bacterium]|jgi:MFS transporter, FSR family, fosmidomycin resistance protein|nr:MFS transporter [Anaerolineae bacterium]MBT7073162.1 MFS transporter [Anaerolineae bacterium]MBT7325635.1 MFS transporter [Anaerolineae bacterium]
MSILFNAIFSSLALGHTFVDLLGAQRAVIFTYIGTQLGISNTALGALSMAYVWTQSLSQPFFGWLSDRRGSRWLAAGGVLWMGTFFSLALLLPGYYALGSLIFASLGSGAFHPAGAAEATKIGERDFAGHETTAASYFFLFGQGAYALGPMLGGPLLDRFGLTGLLLLSVIGVPIGINSAFRLRSLVNHQPKEEKPEKKLNIQLTVGKAFIITLATTIAFQAWIQQTMNTFIPKYLSDLGQTATVYGVVTGLYMVGGALGNVAGGMLADRFGKRNVITGALLLASLPLFAIAKMGWTPWLYAIVPLAGALNGSTHPILVVLAQKTIKGGRGLASGLVLGFKFAAGALGMFISGILADYFGFSFIFGMTAMLALSAAFIIRTLKNVENQRKV